MTTVDELATELLRLPMNAYIAIGSDPFEDIEISIRHFDADNEEDEFDYISLD